MVVQFVLLPLCFFGTVEALPLTTPPSPSPSGNTLMVPVTFLSSYGPQLVLFPLSTLEWNLQRNPNPTPHTEQTPPQTHQHQRKSEIPAESEHRPVLEHTLQHSNTHTLLLTPETALPQGQVFSVWNSLPFVHLQPSVMGQAFVPSLMSPARGSDGVRQVVSIVRQAVGSISESSEEGDVEGGVTQVIYLLPVSDEVSSMGLVEDGQELNTDPDLGHLQLATSAPTPLAGLQESPAPTEAAPPGGTAKKPSGVQQPPAGGSRRKPAGTANPCPQKSRRANLQAKRPPL